MVLQDKLYKSSEVCEILGVSLRTLYRYIEDSKMSSVQLSSGRHRFTKDQIEKFLQLGPETSNKINEPKVEKPILKKEPIVEPEIEEKVEQKIEQKIEEKEEEPVVESKVESPATQEQPAESSFSMFGIGEEEEQKKEEQKEELKMQNFRCPFDDLRVIAKLIKRAGENASADYAFSGPAGLSLFYPIKAFDKLHFYVSPDQVDFWKLRLQLDESSAELSNVVLIIAPSIEVFENSVERGGLKHVSTNQLKSDLKYLGLSQEALDFESKGY